MEIAGFEIPAWIIVIAVIGVVLILAIRRHK